MKRSLCLLFLSVCFVVSSACSKDDVKNPIIGNWKLTSWSIKIPLDLNSDATFSTNLLDETICEVNEILSFDKNGIVTSSDTFNPELKVRLKNGTSDVYMITETCAEGSVGFATEYEQINDQRVGFNGVFAVVTGTKLTVVYKDAVMVYNEALTEVVATKDLTLVYEKR
jgi:hypothetical protein